MKRLFAMALVALFCGTLVVGCSETSEKEPATKEEAMIEEAVDMVKDYWEDFYSECSDSWSKDGEDFFNDDWYLEIKNTRVVELGDTDKEGYENMEYVIEFVTYSNFYGIAPYYSYIPFRGSEVIVFEDGHMEMGANTINVYCANHGEALPMTTVRDYGTKFNAVYHLEQDDSDSKK